jgi:biotin-dependent carboxylase-like uncharacterized protein
MRAMRIMDSGLLTTIQDLGRYGYQRYGVSVSGAMDEYSVKIANKLVGNSYNEAVLETTLKGVNIEFMNDCVFAITGGECDVTLNGKPIDTWRSYRAEYGDIIKMGICKEGMRNYLAFSGGIDVPLVMNSRSTDIRAGIGGNNGKKIMTHDILHISNHDASKIPLKKFNEKYKETYQNRIEIRVVLGQQSDYFTGKSIKNFFESSYVITKDSDRMGMRLSGKEISCKDGVDIISDGMTFGAIQIAGNGQPIIMMADRQTTGGYVKLGNVASADFHKLAQALQKTRIRFVPITLDEAIKSLKEMEMIIASEYSYEEIEETHEATTVVPIRNTKIPKQLIQGTSALNREKVVKYDMVINGEKFIVEIEKYKKI